MKNLMKCAIIILFILTLPASSFAKEKLTIVSWGGAFTKSQILAQVEPYEEKTGVEIEVIDYNGGLKEIRAQVSSYNTKWDLVDMYLPDIIRGSKEGLFEKINITKLPSAPDGTSASKDFLDGTLNDYAVGNTVSANVFIYKTSAFKKDKPQTIYDFFDLKKFPGKRALRNSARINLEWALIADGVPNDKVYKTLSTEEGIERAFKKLNTIKAHVIWWEKGEDPIELIESGKVVMASAWNGRAQSSIDRGKDLTIIWDAQVWEFDLWCIPKRTRNKNTKAIMDFLEFATDSKRLADLTKYIAYGPARKSSTALIASKIKDKLPTAAVNSKNNLKLDGQWWSKNQEKMDKEFSHWKEIRGFSLSGGTRP